MKTLYEIWVCTDPSCNQYRRDISDGEFEFKENRIIDPVTKETKIYQTTINLEDYEYIEILEACNTFGYTSIEVDNWIDQSINLELIAECLFELTTD